MRSHALVPLLLAACTPAKPATTLPPPTTTATDAPPTTAPPPVDTKATKVRDRRGHHRVPAAERAPGAAVPGFVAVDGHRRRHVPGRLARRGLRRDRHGAPPRAHDVQGHAAAPQRAQARSGQGRLRSTATTWTDRTNYFETLPASADNLDWMLDLEADRMIQRVDLARRSVDRVLGRPQRVRDGRERSRRRARASASNRPRTCGTTTASRRSARAPTSSASRCRRCARSTRSTTSRTTRRSSSPASSTRRKRSPTSRSGSA